MPDTKSLLPMEQIHSLCLLAGSLMLSSGAETSRVEETVRRLAEACGARECNIFATPTGIFITLQMEGEVSTRIVRIPGHVSVNLRTVTFVNEISRRIVKQTYSPEQGLADLKALAEHPNAYPSWLMYIAAFLSAGGFTILFGGFGWDFVWGGLSGLAAERVADILGQQVPKFLAVFFGAVVGSLFAEAIATSSIIKQTDLEALMIGAIVPLVPGLAITNSIRDLMAGELISGVARAAEAIFTTIAIAVAVALVLSLGR